MRLAATRVQVACNWQPPRLAASRMLFLHSIGGKYNAKPPVFLKHAARTIIWIKKWGNHKKNLRTYATYVLDVAYPSTLCMARSNLVKQFQKNTNYRNLQILIVFILLFLLFFEGAWSEGQGSRGRCSGRRQRGQGHGQTGPHRWDRR